MKHSMFLTRRMVTRRQSRGIFVRYALIALSITFWAGCGKSPTVPDPPDPPPAKKVRILVTVSASYVLSGLPAAGTVTFQPQGEGATTKNLGEQADLYEIDEGTTKKVTITVEATGALKRVFKDVPLSGTKKFTTTVLELQDFYWEQFVGGGSGSASLVDEGGCNTRWGPETMTVYINPPQHPTMIQNFTESFKDAIRNTIYRYQAASRGWIKSVTVLDGDKTDGRLEGHQNMPPLGEIWIWPSPPSDHTGNYYPQINSPQPPYYGHVDSSITWLVNGLIHELDDAMVKVNQNHWANIPNDVWDPLQYTCQGRDLYFTKWLPFLFSRPISDQYNGDPYGYRIYHDREEEMGFSNGVSGTIEIGASVYVEGNTDDLSGPGLLKENPEARRNSPRKNISDPKGREHIRN